MVGTTELASSPSYIDLMGASTNRESAQLFARYLSTHWRRLIDTTTQVQEPSFDFIVTPKLGSPILAYEFAQIVGKPIALSVEKRKFQADNSVLNQHFDISFIPKEGSTALLVDDSTTGGRLALDAIKNLRNNGYNVKDFLVLFEPTLKDSRQKLLDEGVILHSIVKMPFGE